MEQSRIPDFDPLSGEAQEDWTFSKANTNYMTHGLHPYPARMIPTKRMPWQNAPENIEGEKADTIHSENIVVLRKP